MLTALTLGTGEAAAEVSLRPTVFGTLLIDNGEVAGGGLLDLAVGYNLEFEPLLLVPEIAASFGGYGGGFNGFMTRALGGFRGGFAGPVEPSLFLRGGYGHMLLTRSGATDLAHGGVFQVGLALDYRPERWVTIGGELLYDLFIFKQQEIDTSHGLGLGFTAAFWF